MSGLILCVYRTISSTSDSKALQDDLDSLTKWQHDWQMQFNPSKCYVMHVTNTVSPVHHDYKLCDQTLISSCEVSPLSWCLSSRWHGLEYTHWLRNIKSQSDAWCSSSQPLQLPWEVEGDCLHQPCETRTRRVRLCGMGSTPEEPQKASWENSEKCSQIHEIQLWAHQRDSNNLCGLLQNQTWCHPPWGPVKESAFWNRLPAVCMTYCVFRKLLQAISCSISILKVLEWPQMAVTGQKREERQHV